MMNGKQKWSLVLTLLVMTAWTVHAEMRLIYRGRLAQRSGQAVTNAFTVAFNLYETEAGGTSRWGMKRTVTPDASGNIQVQLADGLAGVSYLVEGAVLTNLLTRGKANYLGITIGTAREQATRQLLTATPRVQRATSALRLADGAPIRNLKVGHIVASEVKIGECLSVTNRFVGPAASSTPLQFGLALDVQPDTSAVLSFRGSNGQQTWGDWTACDASSISSGQIFKAPASGVYFLTTLSDSNWSRNGGLYWWNYHSACTVSTTKIGWWAPGLVFVAGKGQTIELPYLGQAEQVKIMTGDSDKQHKEIGIYYRPFVRADN